jgi:thiol-disulfide isomerase/thioredoxin
MSGRRVKRERAARTERSRQSRRRTLPLAIGLAVLLAAAAAAATLALTRGNSPTGSSGPAARGGSTSAPLELSGTNPITGRPVSLASYAGKPIVLNMWASWCTGCYAEARALATFARTHPQVQVVGVDVQDSVADAKAFYRRFGWRHPSIFDPQGVIAARFGLQGLPATLFLDRQHRVVAKILGDTNLAGFDQGLQRALG